MTWYSTAHSPFGADMGAPPGGGFQVNVDARVDSAVRTFLARYATHPDPA